MKNIHKLITLLIVAMMACSMMVTAHAASYDPAIIDPTMKGSITIEKTETQKHQKLDTNGNPIVDSDGKPEYEYTYTPLAGVTFDAYLIATIETEYVDGTASLVAEPVPTLLHAYRSKYNLPDANLVITGETKYADLKGTLEYMLSSSEIDFKPTASATTKEITKADDTKAAVATLNNLPVGVYLIVESKAPTQIVDRSANFLVSIPMAKVDASNNVTGWNYNIEAAPKNESVYAGAVVLKKHGNDTTTVLQGVEFKLQVKQENNTWEYYGNETYTTEADGEIEIEGLAPGTYRFTEINRGYAAGKDLNTDYIIDKAASYEFTVNNDGTFTSTYAGVANVGGLEIPVNNYKPDLNKQVYDKNDTTWGEMADYNVGDTIPFRIIVSVPKNITQLKTFKVTDTPTNMQDVLTSIAVENGNFKAYSAASDGKGFIITFDPADLVSFAGKNITITYNATLLSDAATTFRADNTAALIYSNEILPEGTTESPKETKIQDDTAVYTFGIDVTKYLGDKNTLAKGEVVTFELYRGDPRHPNAELLKFSQETVGDNQEAYVLNENGTSEIVVDENGKLNVRGLANGTYYLMETKTENGYNLLSAPIEVKISISYKASWSESMVYNKEGDGWMVTKHTVSDIKQYFGGNVNAQKLPYVEMDVVNKKGFTLPLTGGMGTMTFYLAGITMMAFGAVLLLGRRKRTSF